MGARVGLQLHMDLNVGSFSTARGVSALAYDFRRSFCYLTMSATKALSFSGNAAKGRIFAFLDIGHLIS